jgi:hypothetical protein
LKKVTERPRRKCEDHSNMNVSEMHCESQRWIEIVRIPCPFASFGVRGLGLSDSTRRD